MRDTFDDDYVCLDCGRDDFTSINAMMNCDCDKYDRNGYEHNKRGD